jgi:hypothetical protein
MGLEDFKAAYEAMPESISDREDIVDFVAGVAVSYMSVEEAMQILLLAAAKVAEYGADLAESKSDWESKPDCLCPECTAKSEANQTKH